MEDYGARFPWRGAQLVLERSWRWSREACERVEDACSTISVLQPQHRTKREYTTGCEDDSPTVSRGKGAILLAGCDADLVCRCLHFRICGGTGVPGGIAWRLPLPPLSRRAWSRSRASCTSGMVVNRPSGRGTASSLALPTTFPLPLSSTSLSLGGESGLC